MSNQSLAPLEPIKNISRFWRLFIEWISSIALLMSKVLFALDMVAAWQLSAFGYVLVTYYNHRRHLSIMTIASAGITILCFYGWYKWETQTPFGIPDMVIIGITALFGLDRYIKMIRIDNSVLSHIQAAAVVMSLLSLLTMGFGLMLTGWVVLFITHFFIGYVYFKKGSLTYVLLQSASALFALYMIISIIKS